MMNWKAGSSFDLISRYYLSICLSELKYNIKYLTYNNLYYDMTPESRNSSLLGNGSRNTSPLKRTRASIQELFFSLVRAVVVETQRCGKHISAAMNQYATIKEAVFSVGASPRLYNEELTQL
jgi:hypothetical protein